MGRPAVDPETGVLYVNANDLAWTGALARTGRARAGGRSICSSVRAAIATTAPELRRNPVARRPGEPTDARADRQRHPARRGSHAGVPIAVARGHRGPRRIPDKRRQPATRGRPSRRLAQERISPEPKTPYRFTGYQKFLDPDGYPAVAPPWGTLSAIDLNTGEYAWRIPLGEYPELAAKGMKDTGTENYGGPVVTAGGLVFIAATNFDRKIRAFDKKTGALLWEAKLPFSGTRRRRRSRLRAASSSSSRRAAEKDVETSLRAECTVAFALPRPSER